MNIKFKPNYVLIGFMVVIICLLGIFPFLLTTIPAVIRIISNWDSFELQELISVFILGIFFLAIGFVLGWGIIVGFSTHFTETHIRQLSIKGYTKLDWSEIIFIEKNGWWLKLKSQDTTVSLSTLFYRYPENVVEFIQEQLPADVQLNS